MLEFLLLFIALTLMFVIVPIASVYKIIRALLHRNTRELKVWFYGTARTIDIFGNVVAADLFNDTLIKRDGYRFGRRGETISSVIGKNYRDGTLTRVGSLLRKTLDFIDDNHSLESILTDEQINQSKI
jgi:hypothetical protein